MKTFFGFCNESLEAYADNPQVRYVTGTNFLESRLFEHSHTMTQYPISCGCAGHREE